MKRRRAIGRALALGLAALLVRTAPGARADESVGDAGFVAGDRVIFFDDFAQGEAGSFPAQWTLKGPGGGGNPLSIASRDGRSFLVSQTPPEDDEQTPSTVYARLPAKADLPEAFTIEFDAVFGSSRLVADRRAQKQYAVLAGSGDASYSLLSVSSELAISRNAQSALQLAGGGIHHVAIAVQGRSVRAYVDGRAVISDPEGAERPIARIGLELSSYKGTRQDDLMFTGFRVAEARAQQLAR